MNTELKAWIRGTLLAAIGLVAAACDPSRGPQTDSQTNWLKTCASDSECDDLECLCGVCSRPCDSTSACEHLEGASCVSEGDPGAIALCSGRMLESGVCLPPCDADQCADGQMCVAGACQPVPEATARVVVDTSVRYQTLIGFGATLAYAEYEIVVHPDQAALFEAMSSELGLDVLRLRNRYGVAGDDDLSSASTIVDRVGANLGRAPTVLLTSWSPPASLKASGELECQGNVDTCTLARATDGSFDYAGFASYWRESLDAYAAAGVVPDFVSIQNNPDFVPDALTPAEACRLLPTEGTETVSIDGTDTDVEYPGFAEALTAVTEALVGLEAPPGIAAPETSTIWSVAEYTDSLDLSQVDAISHHLYGTSPNAVDVPSLTALGELGQNANLPLLQTEAQADGMDTAVLMHYALSAEGVSAYLHGVLAAPEAVAAVNPGTLITLGTDDFALDDPYHALRHYARNTDPDWIRADAASDAVDLLVTAWLSPDENALTVVLVNAGDTDIDAALDLGDRASWSSDVTRTAFDGIERSAELGTLSTEGIVRVPGQAIVTVALRQ